ncbi:hypothetical protein M1105_17155 [Limibaculum sp. FT325]|uniref:hypothetical protein n=1 Tax=Thermohalobaculum sediminis TaxID=2939436 RepID=UPI0020BE450C|nr:hypothetical protein [Limibaculum sediminis]MCL5778707.1 hypothetical protein [Limibaculum sediminis]
MNLSNRCLGQFCFVVLAATTTPHSQAETLASTNADNRLTLAFDVPDAALAERMPEGWNSVPFGSGPFAGADLIMVFIDSHRVVDPAGKPMYGGRYRGMALAAPAKAEGSDDLVFMVTNVFVSDATINPYKNSVEARVTREIASTGTGTNPAKVSQNWRIEPGTGGAVALKLVYQESMPGRSQGAPHIHSAVEPDFYRVYRFDQFADLLKGGDVDRIESLSLEITVPEIGELFDGSETLVGVLDVPWYMREIWLP